ncbi:hypothetical protein CRG98_016014 [Punica granatum]|uniref:MULE transposase domain-containing protein n=1 Tax=Punica granatum TaxID=22663 RepID=A0A2I0K511_PUNGR|nr:hypothetical protein CRG98_016014 [Punica granatum]
MDDRLSDGYKSEELESLAGDSYEENDKFPMYNAEVEVECTESWKWFFQNLISDVGNLIEKKYIFIFDMQKGLDAAIKKVYDSAPHRFCIRHIWANMTKHAKCNNGELRRALWNCVKATTLQRVTGQDYWERTLDDHVLIPKMKRQPRRPKKQKKKALEDKVPQMPTFVEASFFQPMIAPPVRPPPVRPPLVRPPHTPITTHIMETASSGTAARFATYFQPKGPPPN